jgi:hypothetical protein
MFCKSLPGLLQWHSLPADDMSDNLRQTGRH